MSVPQDVFKQLGISTNGLGCAMLGVETSGLVIDESDLYYNDDLHAGGGLEQNHHVTLRYGITDPNVTIEHVNFVLSEVNSPPPELEVAGLDTFAFPDFDVLKLDLHTGLDSMNHWLYRANALINMLPGINTFPFYVPHVTLAYIKKGAAGKYTNGMTHPRWVYTANVVYSPPKEDDEQQ